jgi:hypothetical protein
MMVSRDVARGTMLNDGDQMTPQQQIVWMRFQMRLAQAIYWAIPALPDDEEQSASLMEAEARLDEAQTILNEFEKENSEEEDPKGYWALRDIKNNCLLTVKSSKDEIGEPVRFSSLDQASQWAKQANLWKLLEPEFVSEVTE